MLRRTPQTPRSHPQPFGVQLAITRDLVSIFEEKGWAWALWCYKDLRDMGLLTPRLDTPWRRFVDSAPVVDFKAQYDALEKPFTDGVGALLQGTDVEPDTREQWARRSGATSTRPRSTSSCAA